MIIWCIQQATDWFGLLTLINYTRYARLSFFSPFVSLFPLGTKRKRSEYKYGYCRTKELQCKEYPIVMLLIWLLRQCCPAVTLCLKEIWFVNLSALTADMHSLTPCSHCHCFGLRPSRQLANIKKKPERHHFKANRSPSFARRLQIKQMRVIH